MTEEEIKLLHDRLTKFRKRCTDHWGLGLGTAKFGSYAPVIAMEMLRNKTDDFIWELTLAASEQAVQRAKERTTRLMRPN